MSARRWLSRRATRTLALVAPIGLLTGCAKDVPLHVPASPGPTLEVRGSVAQDTTHKEAPRMVPPEVYMRTYLQLFGGLSPIDAQKKARGGDGSNLFDTWNDYIASLGFPDYHLDIPRQTQTNALMVATFERLGIALCDRAVEADLKAKPAVPVDKRVVFTFDVPAGELDQAGFATRFDSLHRLMLGYPSALAPKDRLTRFYALYTDIVSEHAKGTPHSKFTPAESGWAAVCYGLVRHPEFHFY